LETFAAKQRHRSTPTIDSSKKGVYFTPHRAHLSREPSKLPANHSQTSEINVRDESAVWRFVGLQQIERLLCARNNRWA
jgi:hypothetical protein